MIRNNAGVVILIAVVIGFIWPGPGEYLGKWLDYLLMILIYLSCLDLELKKIGQGIREYPKLLGALAVVHLVSPLLVFFLKGFFPPEIYLGMILVTAVPSGRSSVFLSSIFGGEAEKALVISTISNMISPIVVPMLVWVLAGAVVKFNLGAMGLSMVKLVIVPIVAALLTRKIVGKLAKISSDLSTLIVFLIILGIVSPIREQVLNNWQMSMGLMLVGLVLMTINFGVGYLIGKDKSEKITFAISSSYKNYSLATIVALGVFNPTVALPSLVYAVANNLLLLPMQLTILKKKPMVK